MKLISTKIALPVTNDEFNESKSVLVYDKDKNNPTIGWYNSETKEWRSSDIHRDNNPIDVGYWCPMPDENDVIE